VSDGSPRLDAESRGIIDEFEDAWLGGRPDIAAFLDRHSGRPRLLLVELVAIDLENRLKRAERARVEDYVAQFPALGDDPACVVDLAAVEYRFRRRDEPGLDLEEYQRRFPACVDRLLDADTRAGLFSFPHAAAAGGLEPGTDIGGVTLVRVIGEGGMGRVYEGLQHRPARPVAVKVMKPGIASRHLLRRFGYEAELLGRLRHPGIAQIFSAGTHDVGGVTVPYFVMEYVANPRTIVQYADETGLSTHERLQLFAKVCDAVAHGHQRGVIHRDLKPGNILVDAAGQPKVIDFGVARATDTDLALTTMQTDVGQLLGTLQYMSPEQFDTNPDDLDVRSDVYSLGIVLYELLAGRPPYDVRRKAVFEIARVVREEEPTPLSSMNRTLRRDVGLIAGKCLEKDRGRRYSSAAELAADVGRYLAGDPIEARSAGFLAGLGRLARRHKVAAAAAGGVVAATLVAAVVTSFFAYEAVQQRRAADQERGRAEAQAVLAETQAALAGARSREAEAERDRSELAAYASTLDLAESAHRHENALRTCEHLDACQWDLRGWEFRHLWRRFTSRQVFVGHDRPIRAVATSPDGSRVASGGDDGTVRIWNAATSAGPPTIVAAPVAVLYVGHQIRHLAWHPTAARLLVGRDDGIAQVWDAAAGTALVTIDGLAGPVIAAAYRPDGRQVLVGTAGEISLHDADGGARQRRIARDGEAFAAAAYSPDGGRVVSAGSPAGQPRRGPEGWTQDGGPRTTIRVWNADRAEEIRVLPELPGEPTTVAFSPDGRRIISSTYNHHRKFFGKSPEACELRSWDAETGQPAVTFAGHHEPLLAVACSPDGSRIASATGGFDNSIRLWDAATGQELRHIKGVRAPVNAVAFSPDGARLFTGSEDAEVRGWDVAAEQPRQLRGHDSRINGVAFSADGRFLASCDGYPQQDKAPGTIRVWETDTGRAVATLAGHGSLVWAVAFSPDGRGLASVGTDRTLRLWDWPTGRQTASHPSEYACVAWRPDGRIVAAAGNGVLDLREAASGDMVRRIESAGRWCRGVGYGPDGRVIAAAWDDDLVLHDPDSGAEITTLRGHAQLIWSLAWSPDGRSIATAAGIMNDTTSPGEWKVWDVAARRERLGAVVPGGGFRGVAWTPDGRRVITGGFDMKIRCWDATHGRPVHAFPTSTLVFTVAASPDGGTIACGTQSRGVCLFDAVPVEDCRVLEAPMAAVAEAWFTADGRYILGRDERGDTRAWSALTGKALATDAIGDLAAAPRVAPDGTRSPDGAWRLRTYRNTIVVRPEAAAPTLPDPAGRR
jgi:WD40 repeat protein